MKKKYYHNLNEKYKGNIILLGINLNKDKKVYSRVIEEYDCQIKKLARVEYIPHGAEKRKKN